MKKNMAAGESATRYLIEHHGPHREALGVLMRAWEKRFGTEPVLISKMRRLAARDDELAAAVIGLVGELNWLLLGHALRGRYRGLIVDGLRIEHAGRDASEEKALWRIERVWPAAGTKTTGASADAAGR